MDENLYSRQLAVLGHDAMRRMQASSVLICGMRGLGVEIAKNVVLGGVKSLTIYDASPVARTDLGSQFFLTEADVGQNRAEATAPKLAELNPYVPVKILQGALSTEALLQFQVIVLTDSSLAEQLWVNDYTHANGIYFISATTCGLFGSVFCDFGEDFTVYDTNGEQPISQMVTSVELSKEGVVGCPDEVRHGFESGDFVTFSEVQGMTQLNDGKPREIKVLGPFTFSIGDTSGLTRYTGGGLVTQIKMPQNVQFKSLRESLDNPEILMTDFAKFERPTQLHLGFQALDAYAAAEGRLPAPGDDKETAKVLAHAEKINASASTKVEKIDESLIRELASQSTGDLPPMCSVIGGLTAQEVMKACSGKFTPLKQHLYFDALESLPEEGGSSKISVASRQPVGDRYDGQRAVFGSEFIQRLGAGKIFVVGSGAIGCELLKNFAMIGLGCGADGRITVTDMDTIETSNLNRQFLFRQKDIKAPKARVAAAAVKMMNPALNIVAQELRVGSENESVYDHEFFSALDGVANALDNVDARTYMDRRCVFFQKPLLESGTLGSKGNVQVVIPHLTESYSSSQDPPEKTIPICTLKNFPNKIEHTLQWARDHFEGVFTLAPLNINKYLTDPNFFTELMAQPGTASADAYDMIHDGLVHAKPLTFTDCVKWARQQFQDLFHNTVAQLLHNFPPDQMTAEGVPFWSGPKRCPTPLVFDPSNEMHVGFIVSAANLRAFVFGLKGSSDASVVRDIAATVSVPPFAPREGVKIAADEKEAANLKQQEAQAAASMGFDDVLDKIKKNLPKPASLVGFRVNEIEFEKDDDTNFHMDFIAATANLRGENYAIKPASKLDAKLIAGKIIPAIATTTAVVAGLVTLELYKLMWGSKKLETYKNGFVNLALPLYAFSEPIACAVKKYNEDCSWTLWDRFEVQGEMTLRQFIDYFQTKHKLEIIMISCGVSMLFTFYMPPGKSEERMGMTMSAIVEQVQKRKLDASEQLLVLEIVVDNEDGEDVEVPFVTYMRPKPTAGAVKAK